MKNSHLILALALIVAAAAYRVGAVFVPELSNLSPIMALAFCGAVYFERRSLWLVPFVALAASDVWIDRYYAANYGYTWELGGALLRIACFAAALGVGALVARRRSALNLISGVLGCSLLFYLVSNTASWLGDVYYARTLAGWWQAMTVGHVEFPPTLWFFRNTLIGDLLFTGVFALVMERARVTQTQTARAA
jgi:hypothetical protein